MSGIPFQGNNVIGSILKAFGSFNHIKGNKWYVSVGPFVPTPPQNYSRSLFIISTLGNDHIRKNAVNYNELNSTLISALLGILVVAVSFSFRPPNLMTILWYIKK